MTNEIITLSLMAGLAAYSIMGTLPRVIFYYKYQKYIFYKKEGATMFILFIISLIALMYVLWVVVDDLILR